MAYLNKVMLIGNLGKDAEIRVAQSGNKCVTFSMATAKRYKDANGNQQEVTTWHNVVGWGKIADTFEQLQVKKGTSIYVEGSIANRTWTDQQGAKRYVTEISMSNFQLLTPRNAQQAAPAYGYPQEPQQEPPPQSQGYMAGVDDDLPF